MSEVLEVLEVHEVCDVSAVISRQLRDKKFNNTWFSVRLTTTVQSNYTGH